MTLHLFYRLCHNNCLGMHRKSAITTNEAISLILEADSEKINRRRINRVSCNVLLVSNVKTNEGRLDFRRDGCGVWYQKNAKSALPVNSTSKQITKEEGDLFLWRTTFQCKGCPSLKRTEIYMRKDDADKPYEQHQYMYHEFFLFCYGLYL